MVKLRGRLGALPAPFVALVLGGLALFVLAAVVVVAYYGRVVTKTMEGRRFTLPARLYSDVWVLRTGDALGMEDVVHRLQRLRYSADPTTDAVPAKGRYRVVNGRLVVSPNDRETAYGRQPGVPVRIEFSGRRVALVRRAVDGATTPFAVFEPEVVGSVFDKKMEDRTLVRLPDVPKVVVDAILSTEDRDFFTHAGLSPKRLVGAVIQGVTRRRQVRGTSTLTQQLVKNLFLTPERTLRRKMVEALISVIVETRYSKDEILESYLNEIYLGQRGSVSVTGIEEAARFYFGKPVTALDLPEAALLAGLISSPGRFSPFRAPDAARERRAVVLKGMRELGKIDEPSYRKALDAPLTAVAKPQTGIQAPHFIDFVLGQAKETRETISQDGLSIFTTLDPEMQAAAQAAVQKGLEELEKKFRRLHPKPGSEPLQAAIIALDPATGSIRALVGGRDYQSSQFNRVVQAKRQPGSLFKPFVFLAAFERRDLHPPITPATILQDSPISLVYDMGEENAWTPKNYDSEFRGPMTARQALEQSINIPTVRVAMTETGKGKSLLPDIIETARKAGITSVMKPYPSLALGAFEISPMEIAAAYAPFANGGFRVHPTALLGVVGSEGRRVDVKDEPIVRAADPDAIAILDSILRGVVDRGTGGSARRLGAQGIFAGKTGTTNDGRDAWFIGFSPRLLVAVWVGFDDNRGLNLSGSMAGVPLFAEFVRKLPSHYFEVPFPDGPNVVSASIDPTTGYLVTEECPESFNELFLAGTQPKERCPIHRSGGVAGGPF